MTPIFEAIGVNRTFTLRRGGKVSRIRAVQDVSLQLDRGEIVGLVGESGSGKTTLSRIMIGIERADSGEIRYQGRAVEPKKGFAALRREVQYVFQDPYNALCPTMRIGDALAEPLIIHRIAGRAERKQRVERMLSMVGLHADIARRLPRQLSGGQRQRVNLARALMLEPKVLICDEIVSGLDVSVQAQVLQLLLGLQQELDLSMLFISHDLRVIKYLSQRVYVMYRGQVVEQGATEKVFSAPSHSYTQKLLHAIPGREYPVPAGAQGRSENAGGTG
ncbi:ABC transporter ATP-binding protein [Oceanibium sediminis]|uniref:ABC transporter ATP-binding protein n=1 Tax=Oceanibium sediminis TaxID=2026339 RepID=UPI000DD451D4|nr:ATP-binding cassette domain-containing protein [Oceanibium sediminis]